MTTDTTPVSAEALAKSARNFKAEADRKIEASCHASLSLIIFAHDGEIALRMLPALADAVTASLAEVERLKRERDQYAAMVTKVTDPTYLAAALTDVRALIDGDAK